jgi:hypothetical protein
VYSKNPKIVMNGPRRRAYFVIAINIILISPPTLVVETVSSKTPPMNQFQAQNLTHSECVKMGSNITLVVIGAESVIGKHPKPKDK